MTKRPLKRAMLNAWDSLDWPENEDFLAPSPQLTYAYEIQGLGLNQWNDYDQLVIDVVGWYHGACNNE